MMGAPDILVDIAHARADRVATSGAAQGLVLPHTRTAPLVPFGERAEHNGNSTEPGILIAEIKRKSPSRGSIAEIPNPEVLAGRYRSAGFQRVSVLTEEERFGGSLSDLVAVKSRYPDLAVLRKDFLLTVEDITVSWLLGADAVLLIAALLDEQNFEAMYEKAQALGIAALIEVHDRADVAKVKRFEPSLVGINSRNLRRFVVDPLVPLATRSLVDWPCDIVYESGIGSPEDVAFVRGSGFGGFLVGEAVARDPELARKLVEAWGETAEARRRYGVWKRLFDRYRPGVPFVKICGITGREDAEAAVSAGADLIGFVCAPSPRQTTSAVVRSCADLDVLKVAVVVLGADEEVPSELVQLVAEGALDFLQFHGDESPATVRQWPAFKAIQLADASDAATIVTAGSPAVLVDAYTRDARGGTGTRLDEATLERAAELRTLWMAGGLNPDNVGDIVRKWRPGLVDVSSGVEREKGRKDHHKVEQFVRAAKGVTA